ncbi:MAG: hypothetical protein EXR72_10650 [Myxococcales bacterium]|nr:hypothetical protein [Myxococcales bacterium]
MSRGKTSRRSPSPPRAPRSSREGAPPALPPSRFILDPPRDLGLLVAAPVWILPLVFLVAALTTDRRVNEWVMALGATGHHLPGMLRAYGDRALFRRFRARFVLAPLILAATGIGFSVAGIHAMVFVAFGWGMWHGMMQSYGFARIYGAKSGADGADAKRDLALLATWFCAAVLFSPQRLAFVFDSAAACGAPLPALATVAAIQWSAASATAAATLAWLVGAARGWRAGRPPGLVRVLLLVSSIAFWWYANVRIAHPLLGMPLFEVFHDVQYLAIVWAFNRRRADTGGSELRPLLRALFRPRAGAALLYVMAVLAYGAFALPRVSGSLGDVLSGLLAASQLLHFYYDGFIWKVREPAVAATLNAASSGPAPAPSSGRGHRIGWSLLAAACALLAYGETQGSLTSRQRLSLVAPLVPKNTIVQFTAAEMHWERGERDQALDGFRRVLALDPGYAQARDNLAISLEELADGAAAAGDEQRLRGVIDELVQLRPRLSGDVAAFADKQIARYQR